MVRLSAPGNLLLAGEYAVLEEGGLGLCLAPEVRATLEIEPAPNWEVEFRYEARCDVWRGEGPLPPLLQALASVLGELPRARLVLDTTAFSPNGQKTGLGSSAAAALLLTAGFDHILHGERADVDVLAPLAVRTHRHFQGGRGSGYDVMCSAWGGLTLFRGGETPSARRLDLGWLPGPALVSGLDPVSTPAAVLSYREWKEGHPQQAAHYLERNNTLISQLANADSLEAALPLLRDLSELSRQLGRQLGRPAEVPPQLKTFLFAKALGAGDELFWVLDQPERLQAFGLGSLDIAWEGLRWE